MPAEAMGAKLDTAATVNPDLVNNPETAYALGSDPTLDGATIGHASTYMDMYDTQTTHIKSAMSDPTQQKSGGGGFFSDLGHIVDAAVAPVRGVVNTISNPNDAKKFVEGAASGVEGLGHEAADAANRIANTTVEELSGGGAKLDTNTGTFGLPTLEGENGKGPSIHPLQALEDVSSNFSQLIGNAPGQMNGSALDQLVSQTQLAAEEYKKNPTTENFDKANALYKKTKPILDAWQANPNLQDAFATVKNLGPANQLLGPNNFFFMMAHTAAYTESLAAKKGWDYALGQLAPSMAIGILTDGALTADASFGTAEYDEALITQGTRAEASGASLSDDELKAIQDAQARSDSRQVQSNFMEKQTADAAQKFQERIEGAGSVRRGLYRAGEEAGNVVRPALSLARGAMAPARSLPLNVMYQMARAAAMGNPDDAALWLKTQNYQVVGANGKEMGQDGTALLKMMDVDPNSMWFSPLSDVADVADFATKWLGADPLAVSGDIIGASRTAEGLSGTILGKWFSGLGITSVDDARLAYEQYPSFQRAVKFMADEPAARIQDRFLGTFTTEQAQDLQKLSTPNEVVDYLGTQAEAQKLLQPLAPRMTAFDSLKAMLRDEEGLGGRLHLTGVTTPEDFQTLLLNGSDQDLAQVGIYRKDLGTLAASGDVESASTASVGKKLADLLGRNPANAVDYEDRATHLLNPLSDDFPRQLGDMLRVSHRSEQFVKAVEQIAINASPDARVNLYTNIGVDTARRYAWSGLDKGYNSLMLGAGIDDQIRREVINMRGMDGGGGDLANSHMVAGEEGDALTPTKDPKFPDRDEKASAVGLSQTGHLKFFRMNELKGLGVYTKRILSDLPTDLVDKARFYQMATEDIERLADYTNITLDEVKAGIDRLPDNIPDDIKGVQAREGYRNAVGTLRSRIASNEGLAGDDAVHAFVTSFEDISKSIHNIDYLHDLVQERNALIDNSTELNDPAVAALDKQIPPEFGIKSLSEINGVVARRLEGQVAAMHDVGNLFTTQLSNDFMWYDDIRDVYDRYQRDVLDNPNAVQDLREEWTDKFAKLKAQKPNFLSWYSNKVFQLNRLLNRTWVPLALTSGAWAFHISVSEESLNVMRNGFLPTFDSVVARNVVRLASGNPTDNYFDGLLTDLKESDILGFRINDAKWREDEGGLLARSVSKGVHGALNILQDAAAGSVLGFNRILLSGMDDAARERMIGDFTDAIYYQDGHLYVHNPLKIDHVSSTFSGAAMDRATKEKVYGVDEGGVKTESNVFIDRNSRQIGPREPGYATALSNWMKARAGDPIEAPVAQELYRRVYAVGTEGLDEGALEGMTTAEKNKYILDRGAEKFQDNPAYEQLSKDVEEFAYQHIENLSPAIRSRMNRDFELLNTDPDKNIAPRNEDGSINMDPHRHWAKAARVNAMNTVSGTAREDVSDGFGGITTTTHHIIHGSLLDQVANDSVKEPYDLADDIKAMPKGTEPTHIPAPQFTDVSLRHSGLAAPDFLNKISDSLHHNVFGPIANNLVRDPLYLLSYHSEMEALRALGPVMSDIEMKTLAETRATMSMIRFVHNPLDKMIIERNLRPVAPFYFAQNQALRRAMRLLFTDPGAAERYMKLSLGVTNYVSGATKNGEQPYLGIPGSNVIGKIASIPDHIWGMSAANQFFKTLDYGASGSPGSISSMFPTGAIDTFSGIAGNLVRPSGGPVENIVGEMVKAIAAQVPWTSVATHKIVNAEINKLVSGALGPEGSESTFGNQLDPSSVLRDASTTLFALYNWLSGTGKNTGAESKSVEGWISSVEGSTTLLSTTLLTMNEAADNFYKKWVSDYAKAHPGVMSDPKYAREVSGLASGAFAKYLQNNQNGFMSSALEAATMTQAQKTLWAIISPLDPEITEHFSQAQSFDNLLAEKNPNGSAKYGYDEAKAIWTAEHPSNVMDLSARSFDDYGPWPETEQAMKFVDNNPEIVKEYPYASAFLMNPNNTYYGPAFDTLVNSGLRSRDTPQELVNALLVNSGESYYKNVLSHEYPNNEQGWGELAQAAANYAITNPIWGEYHHGTLYGYQGEQSLDQMAKMTAPNSGVSNAVFGDGDAASGATIRSSLAQLTAMTQAKIKQYEGAGSTSQAENIADSWYTQVQQMIAIPGNAPYVSFMENVMQDALSALKKT